MSLRTVRGLAAVALLLAGGTGCSALSGQKQSEQSLSAPPPRPSSSSQGVDARFARRATADAVLRDARKDLAAVYSLDYKHLTRTRSAGLAASTGDYADSYRQVFSTAARAAVRRVKQVQTPHLTQTGLAGLKNHDRVATVYSVFDVTTQSKASAAPSTRTVRALVTLKKVGDRWRISAVDEKARASGTVPANSDLARADRTARSAVVTLLTLSRADFDKQYAKALTVQTGTLLRRSRIKRDGTEQVLKKAGYDLSAKVTGLAVVSADGQTVELLLNVNEYHAFSSTSKVGPYPVVLHLTLTNDGDGWLVSDSETV